MSDNWIPTKIIQIPNSRSKIFLKYAMRFSVQWRYRTPVLRGYEYDMPWDKFFLNRFVDR